MNIVFDFGGVLFRWTPQEFLQRLLPARAPDEAAARQLTHEFFQSFKGDWAEFDRGTLAVPELTQRIVQRTGLTRTEVERVIDAVPDELQPLPNTVALLQRLHERGHRLFFLSNMPAPYADHLDATHAFLGHFEAGIYSSRVKLIKPDPALFALAEKGFGVAGPELLFIDDAQHNVDAARAAGWQALLFESARALEIELARVGAL